MEDRVAPGRVREVDAGGVCAGHRRRKARTGLLNASRIGTVNYERLT
jgi:hypothetical protein